MKNKLYNASTFIIVLIFMIHIIPSIEKSLSEYECDNIAYANKLSLEDSAIVTLHKQRAKSLALLNEKIDVDKNIADIISGVSKSKGVFVRNNILLTVAHGIKDENDISVNGRPASILEMDREKDYAILETLYSNETYFELSNAKEGIIKEYKHGDSGTAILDSNNKLYGILIGKKDKRYVILKVKNVEKKINNFF